MRQTMTRTTLALALAAAAALPHPTGAAEQVEIKPPAAPKLTKAERIEKLKISIANDEERLKRLTDEYIEAKAKADSRPDRKRSWLVRDRETSRARLPASRTELGWLEGRITLAGCEKAVKTALESLEKAKDAEKASAQAALASAQAALAVVKKLEAEKDF